MTATTKPSRALETVLKIVAFSAFGLLVLLLIVMATGMLGRFAPPAVNPEIFGLGPGAEAPAIEAAAWINGEPAGIGEGPLVVQGWFYNCPYCWQEAPHLVALSEQYEGRVNFVALSPDPVDKEKLVQEFVASNEIAYPVGYGARSTLASFEAQAFPAVWLIGANGTILWNSALQSEQSLEEAIEAALSSKAA